ncbi:MAG TPA: MFS transporter [Paraburkholderia sp.]
MEYSQRSAEKNTSDDALAGHHGATRRRQSTVRSVIAGTIGNALESFDWSVYSSFAIFFGRHFFPAGDNAASTLSALAVFAVGFAMRPIGGWAIGTLSDLLGRRIALAVSISMMSGSSLAIAILPTYETIGIAAPALLVFFRLVQGLSVGGEYAAAMTFVAESAPPSRRGFLSSFVFFSTALGVLGASALGWVLTRVLPQAAMASYGWRIPFLLGSVGALVGFWIRRGVDETDAFREMRARRSATGFRQSFALLRDQRATLVKIVGMSLLGAVVFYLFTGYIPVYAVQRAGARPVDAYAASTIGLVVFTLMLPLFGYLSDRIGRRPQLIVFALGFVLFAYPIVAATGASMGSILIVELLGLLLYGLYSSIAPAVMAELLPTEVRGVGIGTVYNSVAALLGGTTPYLMLWLQSRHREQWFLGYVCVLAVISLLSFWSIPETRGRTLR